MIKDCINAIRDGKIYTWICNHGHELSKSELCDIIKEFSYQLYTDSKWDDNKYLDSCDNIANALEDIYEDEE